MKMEIYDVACWQRTTNAWMSRKAFTRRAKICEALLRERPVLFVRMRSCDDAVYMRQGQPYCRMSRWKVQCKEDRVTLAQDQMSAVSTWDPDHRQCRMPCAAQHHQRARRDTKPKPDFRRRNSRLRWTILAGSIMLTRAKCRTSRCPQRALFLSQMLLLQP